MQITSNNYSIIELMGMLERRELTVNRDYQRGSGIWPSGPSSYFIDTILEDFPFPKIYMYEYLDGTSRQMKKEIVDGQQRIGTIKRFHANEITLRGDSRFAGSTFAELDEESQDRFLSYTISVDVIRNAREGEILQMFRRMNAYTMPLNEAEKRHSSFQGQFKWFVNNLGDTLDEFFIEFGVFTNRQIVRMADSAILTDCILAFENGVVSSSPANLSDLYKQYDKEFGYEEDYTSKLSKSFEFIKSELGDLRGTHMMKPYALHSLVTALVHCKYGISSIAEEWQVPTLERFTTDRAHANQMLLEMARAHEAKEIDGPHSKYVWGSLSTTDRKARRTARVAAIIRALGGEVPDAIDANLT